MGFYEQIKIRQLFLKIVLFTLLHDTFNKANYTVSQKTVAINTSEYEKVAAKTDNTSAGRGE